jgi:ribosome modulation factor
MTAMMKPEINREAWIAGFHAGETGRPSRTCPYPAIRFLAWSWHSGYIEGDAKRQGFEYSLGTLTPADLT